MYIFNNSYSFRDTGLLILRMGVGFLFVFHGLPKILGGQEKWVKIGGAMKYFGIEHYPEFWGYLAAFAEFGGGLLLIFGMLHRVVCFLLFATMLVATVKHFAEGDGLKGAAHALESSILFFSLMLIGPGKYSFDRLIFKG